MTGTLIAGGVVLLTGLIVRAFALSLVTSAIRGWVWLYTLLATDEMRARRRLEIGSDVYEHVTYYRGSGHSNDEIAFQLLIRWAVGLPSDLVWVFGVLRPLQFWSLARLVPLGFGVISIGLVPFVGSAPLLIASPFVFGFLLSLVPDWQLRYVSSCVAGHMLVSLVVGSAGFGGVYRSFPVLAACVPIFMLLTTRNRWDQRLQLAACAAIQVAALALSEDLASSVFYFFVTVIPALGLGLILYKLILLSLGVIMPRSRRVNRR